MDAIICAKNRLIPSKKFRMPTCAPPKKNFTGLPESCLTPPKSKFLLWQIKTSTCRRQTAKGLPWKKISRPWPTNSTCHSRKYNCDKINDILSFGSVRFQPNKPNLQNPKISYCVNTSNKFLIHQN